MLIDPVCGKRIKRQRAHIAIDFRGVTYYMCCPLCQTEFEGAPAKFARAQLSERTKPIKSNGRSAGFVYTTTVLRGPAQSA
ncbi:MAG: YHS domain-containing protein [Chloroflexi bacterium]|nr:YHS domain-containing protein [Chloroflexota bacterium]